MLHILFLMDLRYEMKNKVSILIIKKKKKTKENRAKKEFLLDEN